MKRSNETCYRCTIRQCTARIYIDLHGSVREAPVPHCHADTVQDMNFEVLRSKCKIAAAQNFKIRPAIALRSQLATLPGAATLNSKHLAKCKAAMYRERRKQLQKPPQSEKCNKSIYRVRRKRKLGKCNVPVVPLWSMVRFAIIPLRSMALSS